jgi:teichuronic acid biosynthesis glycosyltransferase TuaC
MRVLVVASANNWGNQAAPFIMEQAESLKKLGHEIDFFFVRGKGWLSYLKHAARLRAFLQGKRFDLVHAHFVWSALISVVQRQVPVVVTFHGSDLAEPLLRMVSSRLAYPLAKYCIVVNEKMRHYLPTRKTTVIPCGIDTKLFTPLDKAEARRKLGLDEVEKYILFSSRFDRPEKNAFLAHKATTDSGTDARLIEFNGYTREQSALLYSAVDLLLLTSLHEGSPQVIKEAMACNCPIVSTDVGDVKEMIGNTENCHICSFDDSEIAATIAKALSSGDRSDGRERLLRLGLSLEEIAAKIIFVYDNVIKGADPAHV